MILDILLLEENLQRNSSTVMSILLLRLKERQEQPER